MYSEHPAYAAEPSTNTLPKGVDATATTAGPVGALVTGAARASNRAIEQIGDSIQWQHSYVAGDKTFCIYLAANEQLIRKHAELSGIPITRIVEIPQIIDPLTANN